MKSEESIRQEVESCEKCRERKNEDSADQLCAEHYMKIREIRRREELRTDPQRNRVGVQGDTTPDAEYRR